MSFLADADIVMQALERYFEDSVDGQGRVINQAPLAKLVAEFNLEEHARQGGLTGEQLAVFVEHYLETTTRLHQPAYMGHQVAAPHYAGALGAMIDGFTNNGMAIYEMGPGASAIEYFVVNWLLEKVGWEQMPWNPGELVSNSTSAAGVLTHGGSLANLTALAAARARCAPNAWDEGCPPDLALLAPKGAHYSIARAAGLLGLGMKAIYPLEVDKNGVVIPERLADTLKRVEADGRRPMALSANACSTPVGRYDPLQEIGEFCREHGIWFHVDGAHGASALLSERLRPLLRGVELADSLVWDAHKMMRAPTLCAAVLVRDGRTLEGAFKQEASYLIHDKEQPGIDVLNRTVECTKAGLGLRFFLVLAALGERGLAEYVERQYDLAKEAYEYIRQVPGFSCPVVPEANILVFRFEGTDAEQLAVRDRLLQQGNYYISTTEFQGTRYLRLALMTPSTTLDEVKGVIAEIQRIRG